MKKTLSLILAAAMLLSVCGLASADAFFDAPPRSALKLAPMPASVPGVTVEHNEYTNMYTVTASEKPEWACANIWYDGYGHVGNITFDDNGVAVFKGGKAQIGIWWIGGPYSASDGETLSWWMQKGDAEGQYPDEAAALAYAAEEYPDYDEYKLEEIYRWDVNVNEYDADGNWLGYIGGAYWVDPAEYGNDQAAFEAAVLAQFEADNPGKILKCDDFAEVLRAWKLLGISNRTWMAYSGNDALLLGYPGMQVWYTRGGKPVRITVSMSEDPFGTDKEFESASVEYKWSDEYGYKWYVSAVDATYKNGPVKSVHVEYPDTMAGNWLRYTVTLSSGGELTYTR